jgi:3-deoxy-7-phosphoheptulonate synthase/chorismate mutase
MSTPPAPIPPELLRLRARLDGVNRQILALVQARGELVLEVAALKDKLGLDSYDPRREAEMLRELTEEPSGPFDAGELAAVFEALFAVSLGLQRRLRRAAHIAAQPSHGDKPSPGLGIPATAR